MQINELLNSVSTIANVIVQYRKCFLIIWSDILCPPLNRQSVYLCVLAMWPFCTHTICHFCSVPSCFETNTLNTKINETIILLQQVSISFLQTQDGETTLNSTVKYVEYVVLPIIQYKSLFMWTMPWRMPPNQNCSPECHIMSTMSY